MRKLSESVWGDIRKKSLGQEVRSENILEIELQKAKKMEFLDMSSDMYSRKKLLWCPCNFGAESFDQPGMWLDIHQMLELKQLLKGTGYHIADDWYWQHLVTCRCEVEKIKDKTYGLIFTQGPKKLYVPNFGYMSPPGLKPLFTRKTDSIILGGFAIGHPAYITLKLKESKLDSDYYILPKDGTEQFQVRLVKEIS